MASGFDALGDLVRGATFDDFLLRPQFSVIERRDPSVIDLSCRFSTHITLKRPLAAVDVMQPAVAQIRARGLVHRCWPQVAIHAMACIASEDPGLAI